jgi:hypothetical protein
VELIDEGREESEEGRKSELASMPLKTQKKNERSI